MKDIKELIRILRMIEHDHNKVISEEGGDGPDWMWLSGYSQTIDDMEKLIEGYGVKISEDKVLYLKEEDNE